MASIVLKRIRRIVLLAFQPFPALSEAWNTTVTVVSLLGLSILSSISLPEARPFRLAILLGSTTVLFFWAAYRLETSLEEVKTTPPALTFEVIKGDDEDPSDSTWFSVHHVWESPSPDSPRHLRVAAHVRLRFHNADVHPVTLRGMAVSLWEKGERRAEREVATLPITEEFRMDYASHDRIEWRQVRIPERSTSDRDFHFDSEIETIEDVELRVSNFLRLTLSALGQPDYSIDWSGPLTITEDQEAKYFSKSVKGILREVSFVFGPERDPRHTLDDLRTTVGNVLKDLDKAQSVHKSKLMPIVHELAEFSGSSDPARSHLESIVGQLKEWLESVEVS